ncbi:hypothetical protein C0J52_10736 [Blattella germanica]|nr:hypothetical protein C0J52_10736 [Blattella germanica]
MVHINIGSIFRRSRRSETSQNQEKDDKRETRPQVALAVQHFLINIGLGMSMGHSAVLLPQLKEEADSGLQVDEETGSWIASVYMLVSPLGCFLGGVLLEKIGRRSGVLLGQGVYIVGWTVIAAAQNSTMMICGRILDGIAILFDEMAHPRLRVTVLCLASSFLSSGTLVMSSIGSFLHWRTAAALAAVPSIIHIVIVAFLVYETPVYFVKKGKMKEAEKALYWLWGQRKIKVKQELENLATRLQKHETEDKSDDHQQGGCWKILKNKEQYFEAYILKSFLIIHIFNLLQIPGGMGLITLYTVDILNAVQGSVQVVDGNVATIVISAVKVVFLLLSSYLLYRVGRRPMAVISGIGSALPALATAAILYCQSGRILDLDHGTLAWLNFVLVLLYVASNTLGFYCLTYTMIGELLPAKVRGFLFGYIMALNYLVGGGFAKAYPLMLRAMGMEGLFLMFGLSCLLCTLFVFLLLPETLGRTLEEIEDYFHQPNIMWISRKRNDGDVS